MRKLPDIPPEVAKAFMEDLRAFHKAGGTGSKADEIAARQMTILREYQGLRERPVTLLEVKDIFERMRSAR